MKNYFYYFLLPFAVIGCDSADAPCTAALPFSEPSLNARVVDSMPYNAANPYDYAGQLHNELLYSYYAGTRFPTSIDSIASQLKSVALANSNFAIYFGSEAVPLDSVELGSLLNDPHGALSNHLAASVLDHQAQNHFRNFTDDLHVLVDDKASYAAIYDLITTYEAAVDLHPNFSSKQKAFLLHTTSLLRCATHAKKKPRKRSTDIDWDWMTTSIAGSTSGTEGDYARRILTAVALDIADTDLLR